MEVGGIMKRFGRYWVIAFACMALLSIMTHDVPAAENTMTTAASEQTEVVRAEQSPYLIGPGDMIDISVWKDEALTKSVVVLPDGNISFPLIGEIHAVGRPLSEIKAEVEEKVKSYVPEPTVSVEIKQVNSMLVYVIGRVNQPGRFILNTNVNVLQALAMAGGLNPFAKRDKIRILRKEGDKTSHLPVQV